MFSIRKIISTKNISVYKQFVKLKMTYKKDNTQFEFIDKRIKGNQFNSVDWLEFKKDILTKPGILSENNINAVLLKRLIATEKLEPAISFANHLKQNVNDLNVGTLNSILHLYYIIGIEKPLTNEDKKFILDTYEHLYKKYKLLEYNTCESILHALCVIGEWKIGLKVFDDIFLSGTPSHSAFSTLIATLFKDNRREEALYMIQRSLDCGRRLQDIAYNEWIKYVLRNYKDKKTMAKYLDEINVHLKDNFIIISEDISKLMKHGYESLEWKVINANIGKNNGQCPRCNEKLDILALSKEEFELLQKNIMDKLIVGSDLFLKTSPEELLKFQNFLEKNAPFDIVIDALNIAYASRFTSVANRIYFLNSVAEYFLNRNNKVLILGRKHMLKWSNSMMAQMLRKTSYFFTDDISQDDPYLITAAILSGPHTGIVSKDMLRGHKFKLGDMHLREIFQRWQWENQWMVFSGRQGGAKFKKPLNYTPCAQKKNEKWHIPTKKLQIQRDHHTNNNELPDSWLCIKPPWIK